MYTHWCARTPWIVVNKQYITLLLIDSCTGFKGEGSFTFSMTAEDPCTVGYMLSIVLPRVRLAFGDLQPSWGTYSGRRTLVPSDAIIESIARAAW